MARMMTGMITNNETSAATPTGSSEIQSDGSVRVNSGMKYNTSRLTANSRTRNPPRHRHSKVHPIWIDSRYVGSWTISPASTADGNRRHVRGLTVADSEVKETAEPVVASAMDWALVRETDRSAWEPDLLGRDPAHRRPQRRGSGHTQYPLRSRFPTSISAAP